MNIITVVLLADSEGGKAVQFLAFIICFQIATWSSLIGMEITENSLFKDLQTHSVIEIKGKKFEVKEIKAGQGVEENG